MGLPARKSGARPRSARKVGLPRVPVTVPRPRALRSGGNPQTGFCVRDRLGLIFFFKERKQILR